MTAKPHEISPIIRACAILAGVPVHEVTNDEKVRGISAMAKAIKVSKPTVSQWCKHKRPIPPTRCPQIEQATRGAVTCEELRPDVNWSVLRDHKRKRKH